jgi:hypothetical protein
MPWRDFRASRRHRRGFRLRVRRIAFFAPYRRSLQGSDEFITCPARRRDALAVRAERMLRGQAAE